MRTGFNPQARKVRRTFKLNIFIAAQFLFFNAVFSQENNLIQISGQVTDGEKAPLPNVSVQVKGTVTGTITNSTGNFLLKTKSKLPLINLFKQ